MKDAARSIRLAAIAVLGLLTACGSSDRQADRAQERAYEAQQRVAKKERLDLVDRYQDRVHDAGSNQTKVTACETYLKAADALK